MPFKRLWRLDSSWKLPAMAAKFLRELVKRILVWCKIWGNRAVVSPISMEDTVRSQPALPEAYPLTTLEELEELSYLHSFHFPFNKSSVPLPHNKASLRPRLLVCHDMKGGYLDDKWAQGSPNCNAYSLWHWYLIDIFVYFSHSLVTLPPPCWINAAHRHGVQVLGTFITEWDAGKDLCRRLLASKESTHLYASRLAKLAEVLGFDGWLINIENEVDKEHINNLLEFVRLLTKFMHEWVPGSTVIWYDSVTKDGKLNWQDCLNDQNKCFFDLCDGIFTNYTWKENYPKMSAAKAGETRRYDVYMGIDVFGRNTYGGGEFHSNVGLRAARNAGVSAALFAPGWVYETQQGPDFISAQNQWWGLVAECWPSAQRYPIKLPFFSNFNQGFGKEYYANGSEVSALPWSNISCQNLQPLLHKETWTQHGATQHGLLESEVSAEYPIYSGGACVKFSGSIDEHAYFSTTLFEADVTIDIPFHVTYSVRSNNDSSLSILLKMRNKTGIMYVLLESEDKPNEEMYNYEASEASSIVLLSSRKAVQVDHGWILCKHTIETPGKLEGIFALSFPCKQRTLAVSNLIRDFCSSNMFVEAESSWRSSGPILYEAFLGHIAISTTHEHYFDMKDAFEEPLESSDVLWEELSGKKVISLTLNWRLKREFESEIMNHEIFVRKGTLDAEFERLGVAMVGAFYVSQLEVPVSCRMLTFYLQTFCNCGFSGTLDSSLSKEILVPSASY